MKLRNRKTGGVIEMYVAGNTLQFKRLDKKTKSFDFNSLKDLIEEWEDYEEPKESYFIDCDGKIYEPVRLNDTDLHNMTSIGNYFETREEAEQAVEKLKAWKRLKDKGFRFIDHLDRDSGQGMTRYEWDGYINGEDLDLLFGDEE